MLVTEVIFKAIVDSVGQEDFRIERGSRMFQLCYAYFAVTNLFNCNRDELRQKLQRGREDLEVLVFSNIINILINILKNLFEHQIMRELIFLL